MQDDSKAIASLVLGIISIPLSLIPFIGIILGILAIYYYRRADTLMKAQPSKYSGRGMAIAGLVTGIVGLASSTLYLFIWLIYIAIFASIIRGGF